MFFSHQKFILHTKHFIKNLLETTKKGVNSTAANQCPYCNNFFFKSKEKMKKHISSCTDQSEFNFVFDNGKIVDYQDNY